MLRNTASRTMWLGRVTVFLAGLILASVLSIAIMEAADAAPLNKTERLLASGRGQWFEHDWDGDWVCYLYDFKRGTTGAPPHLRVVKHAYPLNLFTGECSFSRPLAPSFGGVGQVNKGVLKVRWPSGHVERVRLVRYFPTENYMRINRSSTGLSWWLKL